MMWINLSDLKGWQTIAGQTYGIALPDMDKSAFESVAQIMTAKELFAFKNAFEGSASEKSIPMPQLAKNQSGKRTDLGKFKI